MRVGIAGGGFAGLAAAILLGRAGHDVTVFEAVSEPAPIGAGILIQPTGMAVLARMGLYEAVLARAARIGGLRMRTVAGRELMNLAYGSLGEGWFGAGLHRGALHQCLIEAVRRELPTALRCGFTIVDVIGRELVDEDGTHHGPYDVMVVADGARSRLRGRLGGARVHLYRWATSWLIAPDPRDACGGELLQVVEGTRRLMGLLPTGFGPRSGGKDTPLVSIYWGIDHDRLEDFRAAGLAAYKAAVARFDPRAAELVAGVRDFDEVLVARYQRVVMRPWHRGRVVFIGDAAHAMSPQLGQGTNLALWDAMVLADCLAREGDAEAALAQYSRLRRAPLAYYEWAAHWLMPLFQSSSALAGPLRDLLFRVLSSLPFARGQMLRTMAGVKRGFLRPSLDLAPHLQLAPG